MRDVQDGEFVFTTKRSPDLTYLAYDPVFILCIEDFDSSVDDAYRTFKLELDRSMEGYK